MNRDDIAEYIYENEQYQEREITCPYCKYKHTEADPYTLYTEVDNKKFKCEMCGREFLLASGFDWWYTTTPIESEVKDILTHQQEDRGAEK